jgi:hypothetical protein
VEKTASPLSLPEPGGLFTFGVTVTNSSADTLTVTSLVDDVYGDLGVLGTCTELVGAVLVPDESASCSFDGEFTGNAADTQTDTITVTATDDDGATLTDTDDAVVGLTDVPPTVAIDKAASPSELLAPGGTVTFTVLVTNTSAEPVTITALVDDVHGPLTGRPGTCATALGAVLAPAASLTCSFEADVAGTAGQTETDVVTVEVTDDDGTIATASDDAVVTLTATPPTTPTTSPPTTAPPTTTPRPTPTTVPAKPLLAATGAETTLTLSAGVGLVGVGLVLLGWNVQLRARRRRGGEGTCGH